MLQGYIGRLAQVVLTEESVDLLHTEGLISKDTLAEVKSCGFSLVGDPMLLILSAVAEDHNKLCTLTSILMKSKEAVSLASDIIMKYGNSFPSAVAVMPPCQQTNTSSFSASQQLQDSSSEIQVNTNTDATAHGVVEVIVHPGYKAEFDRMGDLRGTLIDDIAPLIEKSIPSLTHLKTYLGRCRPELKPRLKDANSFDDIMEVIEDECSITNVALLETIVNKYSIQDAGDMILAYQAHLDEFCENKLTMFCNHQLKKLSSSLLTCETIKFVLKWNPSEHSLSSIRALLWKTFKDNQVEVVVIKEGNSINVTCYAPHYLMESLLVSARDNIDVLKEMGLISLTIGYYTVYDEHAIDEEVKSLMKKLEVIESERDDLLEENAKLKSTKDTLGREIDENNKSSMQSSVSGRKDSKKMTKAMQMEIDHLRSSLQCKTGKDQSTQYIDHQKGPVYVAIRDWEAKNITQLSIKKGEKLGIKKERTDGWWLAKSLDTDQEGYVYISDIEKDEESELSTLETLELFHYAMTENVDIPKIKELKMRSNVERARLFWSLIKQDSVLLDQLRRKEREKPKAIRWYDDGVQLTSPSLIQCKEVASLLTYKHTNIKIIKSSPDVVSDLLPVLLQNEKVEYLRIRDTQLTQDCISSLCNLLANSKSLVDLHLINCSIDDKAVADITNILCTHNNTLLQLFFFKNPHITSASAQSLSELISNNSTLTALEVRRTSISSAGILLILQSLTMNKNIKLILDIKHKDTCTEYQDYNIMRDRVLFY
uniref:SH3 domain-containing protein n=1 Tax=Amphimedon queenslandica TaxID=400682 RepID=A0A1X7U0S5_AMPQE